MDKRVIVFGLGYVGLSNAILLAQKNDVIGVDVVEAKIKMLNNKKSPITDKEIQEYLNTKTLNLVAKLEDNDFAKTADFAIIATPTNFDEENNCFNTTTVDTIIANLVELKSTATIVIKSTIPIGYTKKVQDKYPNLNILFSPEFLREGQALKDNLYPSRIIVGCNKNNVKSLEKANEFANLLKEGAISKEMPLIIMSYPEAESVKLFSNTYLAMRVAYFNEVDNFAIKNNLSASEIIEGMCADPRIGDFYNNPSFGYGGYCFPKDTKQLKANYDGIPNSLIDSIVDSNAVRKRIIADTIIEKTIATNVIGVYRLIMKTNSDNFRSAAIFDIIKMISKKRKVIVYEPSATDLHITDCEIINDLVRFKEESDIIVANRMDNNLVDVAKKVYTRDIYRRD